MNLLDVLILLLLGVSVVTGFRRGAALQVIAYTGLLVGLVLGALLAPGTASLVQDPVAQAITALGTLVVVAAIFDAVAWSIGARVWAKARESRLGAVDAWGGIAVGMVATLLAVWFLAFNLIQGPFPPLSRQIQGSAIVRGLDTGLPRPPSILAQVRSFLDRFGFPEVFADLPPAPAGPVRGPSEGQAGRAIRAADQSTVKIVGRACDAIQEGSGFVAAEGYVVSNAHVVAGVTEPEVQAGGATFPASVVLFDPNLDLAVLRVDGSLGDPLTLLEQDLGREAVGAVLGYPEGGPLRGRPAAVRRMLSAVGRDIYGRSTVRREVYELQATVRPGNSGGPFVTPEGGVAGVVFAASTTDGRVGYALTSTEVLPQVRRGLERTEPTGTGPCVR